MKRYLTYSGNDLVAAELPDSATILYPPPPIPGIPQEEIAARAREAFESPHGIEPLSELVGPGSKVLIAFDDNCQPFPLMAPPDIRQTIIEELLRMLFSYGVAKDDIELRCAVALHRKMEDHELEHMLGSDVMAEFFPEQLRNFDAEDPDDIVDLGETDHGEPVETSRAVVESDLVIYVDTIQIPLNGGHKSVAVGFGTYDSIAPHHAPQMTAETPHVMQPDGSCMHASIERISRELEEHARILVLECAMNNATYPPHLSYLAKPPERMNPLEKAVKAAAPRAMGLLPEKARAKVFRSIRSDYDPIAIRAGTIDEVHPKTLADLRPQLEVEVDRTFDTLVFGLPDLSPYSVGCRINPVLVVSDVLGYVFNWFWNEPFVKEGGVVIILNPCFEIFHERYHVAYRRFYDEVLRETHDPFEMQAGFQEEFARDPELVDAYRHHHAHHGFHPFTVWNWATYPLQYLSKVILVGPEDDRAARRLGVSWAASLDHALGWAGEITGGDDVLALTIPPFMYLSVTE